MFDLGEMTQLRGAFCDEDNLFRVYSVLFVPEWNE
jgi:hypothetical protein